MPPLPLVERGVGPEMRVARRDLLGEGQDALYVEIVDGRGLLLDPHRRQLLAQPVALPRVGLLIDRLLIQEGVIEPIESLLHSLHAALGGRSGVSCVLPKRLPGGEHVFLHQSDEPSGWLEFGEQLHELALKDGLVRVGWVRR